MLRSAVCSVLVIALFAIVGSATEITGVIWDPDMNVIHIALDAWPGNWGGWRMYVNRTEIPMEPGPGGDGKGGWKILQDRPSRSGAGRYPV